MLNCGGSGRGCMTKGGTIYCRDLEAQTDIIADMDSWYLAFNHYVTNNFLKGSGESIILIL